MEIDKNRLIALRNEVLMAEKLNKEELEPICQEAVARYTGRYVPKFGGDWDIWLNEMYPIIQSEMPSIFFRNPRAFLKPRNKTFIAKQRDPLSGKMVDTEMDSTLSAKTQESILNYALVEINYKKEARRCLADGLLFPHAILWHGYKGNFGMTEEKSIYIKNESVFVKRLSPLRFIKDPAVSMANLEEAKWVGRIIDVPLQDLIEDDKLDVDKNLTKGFKGYGDKFGHYQSWGRNGVDYSSPSSVGKSMIDFTEPEYQNSSSCRFVKVYEIWCRPTKKEMREGKNGKIILLSNEQKKPLRENDWTVKAEGWPAKLLCFNELNDAMFSLADFDVYKGEIDQKNTLVNLMIRNAQENTKNWIGISKEGANEEDIEKVVQGQNTIIMFESGNPRDRMFVANPGGMASQELYMTTQQIQRSLDDKSGVNDLKRGYLQSGEESATSVKMRSAGASARPAYRQDIMSDFLKESIHYISQLLKQFVPYKDAVRIVGSLDIQWSENPTKEELQADTDVEIDVISMLPENPEKELGELNNVLTLMMQALTVPEIRTKLQEEGKTVSLTPIIEQILLRLRINNPDVFRNIKPEESEGFVSVQQIRQAKENVNAALTGQQVPFPPNEADDHVAKLEVYSTIKNLLDQAQQQSDILNQLIQIQMALLQQAQEKQATPGIKLPQGKLETVGS